MPKPDIDRSTILKLSQLCRIECTEEEQEMLLRDLTEILHYIEKLDELDTTDVAPCNHVLEGLYNAMRDDEVGPVLDRKLFLANAASHTSDLVRVPPVIKQN